MRQGTPTKAIQGALGLKIEMSQNPQEEAKVQMPKAETINSKLKENRRKNQGQVTKLRVRSYG